MIGTLPLLSYFKSEMVACVGCDLLLSSRMEEVPCSDQIHQFKTGKYWSSLPGTCCQPDGSRIPRPIFHVSSVLCSRHIYLPYSRHVMYLQGKCQDIF